MRILILGDTGLIGKALVHVLKDHEIIGLSRSSDKQVYEHIVFDLETDSILPILNQVKADLIISATRGDFDKQIACHDMIIHYAKQHTIPVHFYSTANAFDGIKDKIHGEMDQPLAESPYGQYKIKVEEKLVSLKNFLIIRLPIVFGADSPRVQDILKHQTSKESMTVYNPIELSLATDQYIAQTHKQLIEQSFKGIVHITSADTISMVDFYKLFLNDQLNIVTVDKQNFALTTHNPCILENPLYIKDVVSMIQNTLSTSSTK